MIIDKNIGEYLRGIFRGINRAEFENIVHLFNGRHSGCDLKKLDSDFGNIIF